MGDPMRGSDQLQRHPCHALKHSRGPSETCYASKTACKSLITEKNLTHSKICLGNNPCYF